MILLLGSIETINQLAIANIVRWHGYVSNRDDHTLRMALNRG